MSENEYPEVDAVEREDGYGLKMYCIYCKTWHLHGHGEGHRIAHCAKQTPYSETGYVLIQRNLTKPAPDECRVCGGSGVYYLLSGHPLKCIYCQNK